MSLPSIVAKGVPIFALALTLTGAALAQQPPDPGGPPPPLTAVADSTLRALKERRVTLTVGQEQATGRILGFEADSITLAHDDGTIATIPRALVVAVRLDEIEKVPVSPPAPPPVVTPEMPPSAPEDAEPPMKPRYFGVHLGMAPGVALDVDYEYFHAFASTSWLFPLVTSGQMVAFTAGMGASIPFSPRWRFDVFGHVAPIFESVSGYSGTGLQPHVGFGLGIGLHYTAPSGFSIGVKLPVIGAATTTSTQANASVGEIVGWYYLASAFSLPVFSVGYRF